MRFFVWVLLAAAQYSLAADDRVLGFDEASSNAQRTIEARLDASIDKNEMDQWLRRMSAKPHHVGSPGSKENAEFMASLLESWGYAVEIAEYEILLPTPKVREVELVAPTEFTASLTEDSLAGDPSTFIREDLLPPYNAFSVDGEVEAELVFVNYGRPEDYEILDRYGIDVKGKIAIAKYGRSWRGIKPKLAGEKGAIGTLIYSDPADDGYGAGDVYPKGPFKHESGVQRGSVMDMPTYPGDVLTPGRGATRNAKRLQRKDASTITKIPVLPISYKDALPLLSAMDGAADPLSGLITMLAEAKAVAALANSGERPRRTVIYAAWDAEEPGLIGSTEWAEHHAKDLKKHAVAYLNTDGTSRGFIGIGGSHVLERFFNQIIEDVQDPRLDMSLKERARARQKIYGESEQDQKDAERADIRIYPLGSGSDYTPFLQHLGIASANLGFGGEASGGSYHTLYDTYEHFTTWNDPELTYTATLPKVTGRATLRLANAPRLPFEFTGFADNIALYVAELEELADAMRAATAKNNDLIESGAYAAALDPNKSPGAPAQHEPVPHFGFAPLKNALARLQTAAAAFDTAAKSSTVTSEEINNLLYTSERLLTRDEGLEGRPWYKHQIYAPGFYTGYGVKTIPGVREAIEQREYEKVAPQIEIAAAVLNNMAARIEQLTSAID
jgi:N-acetylated-alpha-linked acidic dipeptidase